MTTITKGSTAPSVERIDDTTYLIDNQRVIFHWETRCWGCRCNGEYCRSYSCAHVTLAAEAEEAHKAAQAVIREAPKTPARPRRYNEWEMREEVLCCGRWWGGGVCLYGNHDLSK